ncbi:MAG: hypothetical protein M0Z53_14110 [Thermaerobacter sp.]|nr:hypothetical protein [Thermaerobacter sp.]
MSSCGFALGSIYCTPGILALTQRHPVPLGQLLVRHATGDWGEIGVEDWQENDLALRAGLRLFSVYKNRNPPWTVWIITEADRAATTLLLPEEY